jgi:hypothetical protein
VLCSNSVLFELELLHYLVSIGEVVRNAWILQQAGLALPRLFCIPTKLTIVLFYLADNFKLVLQGLPLGQRLFALLGHFRCCCLQRNVCGDDYAACAHEERVQ